MKTITAKFKGEDGSMGFKNGSRYKLVVTSLTRPLKHISIQSVGVLNTGGICVYSSAIKFLENWTDINTD